MLRKKMPPVHPSIILHEDVINESGLTVTDAAKMLGVTRTVLSSALNGKTAIGADITSRIEAVFGGTAELIYIKLSDFFTRNTLN